MLSVYTNIGCDTTEPVEGTTYPLDLIRSRLSIATASIVSSSPSPTPSAAAAAAQPALASAYHTSSAASSAALRSQSESTMWGMTLKVVREEGGVRALYRGMVATATGVAPYVGINFASYELLRGIVTPPGKSSVVRKLSCGALAGPSLFSIYVAVADGARMMPVWSITGAVSQTITYPFDVVRRKMQVSGMSSSALGYKYSSAIDATRSIIRNEGVRGMYRGLWPNLREWLSLFCGGTELIVFFPQSRSRRVSPRLFSHMSW